MFNSQEFTFPVHHLVWNNSYNDLKQMLPTYLLSNNIDAKDPRGRTALMLAVVLNYIECAKVLVSHNASVLFTHNNWTVLQEAISTKNKVLIQLILAPYYQADIDESIKIAKHLFETLQEAPDFYTELNWNVTTFIPLLSRYCPHDNLAIYKKGCYLRIDGKLIGMGSMLNMKYGSVSYILRLNGNVLQFDHLNHKEKTFRRHSLDIVDILTSFRDMGPSEDYLETAAQTPMVTNVLDQTKELKSARTGFFWRSNLIETINGHKSGVYDLSSISFLLLKRTEHLEAESKRTAGLYGYFAGFKSKPALSPISENPFNPFGITEEDYFDPSHVIPPDRDIGRVKIVTKETKQLVGKMWLCPELSQVVSAQIRPLMHLVTQFTAGADRVEDLLLNRWPSGFPLKMEFPLFSLTTLTLQFKNVNSLDEPVSGVTYTTCCPVHNSPNINNSIDSPEDLHSPSDSPASRHRCICHLHNKSTNNMVPPTEEGDDDALLISFPTFSLPVGLNTASSDDPDSFNISSTSQTEMLPRPDKPVPTYPVDPITIDPSIFDTPESYTMKDDIIWTPERIMALIEMSSKQDGHMASNGLIAGLTPNYIKD